MTEPRDPATGDDASPSGGLPADEPSVARPASGRPVVHADLAGIPAEEIAEAERLDLPGVNEDVEQGAVPLSSRLRSPRTIISIVVPIVVVVLILTALPGFKLDQLATYVSEANPWWLLAALGIYYLGFPLRGYRWALLVRGAGYPLRVRDSTEIILISWLVNCLVPAKLGDVYRAYLLRINTGVSLSKTFGTVFIERMFDLIAIATLGLAAGFWSFRDGMSPEVRVIFGFGLIVLVVLVVGLVLVRNFGRRILVRLPIPHRVVEMYDMFEEGMFAIDRRTVVVVGLTTGLIWTTEALRLLFVVESMPFDVQIGISGAFFIALIASLLTAVPFTPAGLGLADGAMVFVLTAVYDVPQTEAVAITLVDRAISVLSVIVVGGIAYVLSSKTRGDPEITSGRGLPADVTSS
ncbi:MAG: flippase-like domain-containing protein [Chloroflexi bacterium]|nr:flippase-like domain-containing protein [Chloroflexota bacterium]